MVEKVCIPTTGLISGFKLMKFLLCYFLINLVFYGSFTSANVFDTLTSAASGLRGNKNENIDQSIIKLCLNDKIKNGKNYRKKNEFERFHLDYGEAGEC
jgi:hypothetical protein